MSSASGPLSAESIRAALAHIPLVRRVVYLPSVGSTNDAARVLGERGAPHATLVVADDQTTGRGRLGRSWTMPPLSGLALSILVRPDLAASRVNRLTMLAGLAAAEGIEQATGLAVDLKWPNDVVIQNAQRKVRKLGGILCESALVGEQIDYAVVGIGLNLNFDFADQPELSETATSVMLHAGHEVDRLRVLAAVIERFAARFADLHSDRLRVVWAERLLTLGRRVEARAGAATWIGLAEAVDGDGALLLRTDDGTLRRLQAADVTLQA
ncbi:MAG TPA: biotin--[acetyl-CoA-carboxylase] ligase [Anaerolineae bacterium]|nr:biotin--[acetyl-CoA-carboxylase] ligase [Anaerolineae bacterium]